MKDPAMENPTDNLLGRLASLGLPRAAIIALLDRYIPLRYPKGTLLSVKGSPADVVFAVLSGVVKVDSTRPGSDKILVELAGPGDIVGYADFSESSGERSQLFEAEALSGCTVALFTRDHIIEVLRSLHAQTSLRTVDQVGILELLRSDASAIPNLPRFAIAMAIVVGIPLLFKRIRLPALVGLLLSGVVLGPNCLALFGENRAIGDLFADLGQLMMMFFSGLETDLAVFRRAEGRLIAFGLITTLLPLLLGTVVGLWFGCDLVPAIVVGSLVASHTLLASPIVRQLGASRLEPMTVTVGGRVLSDTLSLVVFSICVGIFKLGFSISALTLQLIEIIIFVPLILFGLSRAGAYLLSKVSEDESAYFILMLGIMAVAGILAEIINLPGNVGAFLAGLSVNAAVHDKPVKEKLEFFGNSFFIPIFFMVTGFRIEPQVFVTSLVDNFFLVAGLNGAVVIGKGIAAASISRVFGYTRAACLTMWSLTLPQVASTLAAALVGFGTFNRAGQRLLEGRTLNAIFVLMLTTAILGPILTDHFLPVMLESEDVTRLPTRQPQARGL